MDGRRVTDFERIVIYFSAVAAVFLAAMAWGWQNLWLLLAAVIVLAAGLVGVIAVVARRGAAAHEIATARVISVSAPPPNIGIATRCDMYLEVRLAGRPPVRTRHRDPAVPLTRWPHPGQTFPVDVYGGNPRRRLRIRWDLVEQGMARAPDASQPTPGGGPSQAPMWEEENEPVVFSPTPPRPRRPQTPAQASSPPSAPAAETRSPVSDTTVFLHETFTDIDEVSAAAPPATPEESVGTPPPTDHPGDLPPRTPGSPGSDANGHDPDGFDPADFETPRLTTAPPPATTGGPGFEALTLSEFDPAEVDIRDFTDEPPAVTGVPADDEEPHATSPPTIPFPRDPTPDRGGGTGISATRPVAELPRSVRFYCDALGFRVTGDDSTSAVVEHRGTRVLIAQAGETAPLASGEISIDVVDIEARCAAARVHGGEVVAAPAAGSGDGARRARLHDPDGHAVELVESRHRRD